MGLDNTIALSPSQMPAWPALAERLTAVGVPCQLRMIDGELAFPDETPPDDWRELRLGTAHGIITMRREADGVRLVIWGNAEPELLLDRDRIAGVLGESTQGARGP